tara:strand:- start:441 stop:1151 length:711 start_codon:yes stop_codon:yes gene_type:complete
MDDYVPAKPAGTVVLLRASEQSFEVLLLKRNPKLAFAGGVWVFPGGAVDEDETRAFADECSAAKVAARREIFEECGLDVGEVELRHFCKWTTPREEKKRFSTWFFVAVSDQASSRILVDGSEIIDYQWISPKSAIQKHQEGSISFMPPTFLVLRLLSHFDRTEKAFAALKTRAPYDVTPKMIFDSKIWMCMYPGDAGYEIGDLEVSGPRHRTYYSEDGIQYVHSGDNVGFPAMDLP